MHDLHTADKVLKISLEKAAKNKLEKIREITIELGSIIEHGEEINPENLKFNLALLAKGTIAQTAAIKIIKKKSIDGWKLTEIEGE